MLYISRQTELAIYAIDYTVLDDNRTHYPQVKATESKSARARPSFSLPTPSAQPPPMKERWNSLPAICKKDGTIFCDYFSRLVQIL